MAINASKFWAKVDLLTEPNLCWEWKASCLPKGYGLFHVGYRPGKNGGAHMERAHRVAWKLHYGDIPEGMHVLHSCDNPKCCNINHLFLGTNKDNVDDKVSKGRAVAPRGEAHYEGKLNWEKVDEIRERYAEGRSTYQSLAEEFGVSSGLIGHIVNFRKWKPEHRPA